MKKMLYFSIVLVYCVLLVLIFVPLFTTTQKNKADFFFGQLLCYLGLVIAVVILMRVSSSDMLSMCMKNVMRVLSLVLIVICVYFICGYKPSTIIPNTTTRTETNTGTTSLKCKSQSDCGEGYIQCQNGVCTLPSSKRKAMESYLSEVYYISNPSVLGSLSDVELNNLIFYMSYYWLSYHPGLNGVFEKIQPNFSNTVMCGGYYAPDVAECNPSLERSDNFWQNIAPTWPSGNHCCKRGTLALPAAIGQLYFTDYLDKSIEVFRNGYDYKNIFMKSVLFDAWILYKRNKLGSANARSYLPLLKDGVDGSGVKLSHKCCDNGSTYDPTLVGSGYQSNAKVEVSRNAGYGGSPDGFYYASPGSGNFLDLGVHFRTMNKIEGLLLVTRRAGETNFGSVNPGNTNDIWTITKPVVTLSDGHKYKNSFVDAPQLFLLEFFHLSNFNYSMNNPVTTVGFGMDAANAVAPNVSWPFKTGNWHDYPTKKTFQGYQHTYIEIIFTELLIWYFGYRKVTMPPIDDYKNNWSNWSKSAVDVLGGFFDAVTVPEFDQWQLNYCFSKIANSSQPDYMFYQMVNPAKTEIHGQSFPINLKDNTGQPWDGIRNNKGDYITSIGFCTQPSGSGNWSYEIVDYRINIGLSGCSNMNNTNTCRSYWSEYINKFMFAGSPLTKLQVADPVFCGPHEVIICEPDEPTVPSNWDVMIIQPEGYSPATDTGTSNVINCGDGTQQTNMSSNGYCPHGNYMESCGPNVACDPSVMYNTESHILSGSCMGADNHCVNSQVDMSQSTATGTNVYVNNCLGKLQVGPCLF